MCIRDRWVGGGRLTGDLFIQAHIIVQKYIYDVIFPQSAAILVEQAQSARGRGLNM